VSIDDEIEAYVICGGVRCSIAKLLPGHPSHHAAFMEAVNGAKPYSAIVRWWNAKHAGPTGLRIGEGVVRRHRQRGCAQCR
jgi:hypothetical protein